MIRHVYFIENFSGNRLLYGMIYSNIIYFAGNSNLKIYGKLDCSSGKKMYRKNRIFFGSSAEAVKNGFRPCARCMKNEYLKWKEKI